MACQLWPMSGLFLLDVYGPWPLANTTGSFVQEVVHLLDLFRLRRVAQQRPEAYQTEVSYLRTHPRR